ncbi:PriCT-2 domain-containing protein, partial [Kingella kingae]|uniref:PriCT-2 domain-containing protein n=1 Tax=Kingella kingae TaxID=504 RepID=UPI00254E3743
MATGKLPPVELDERNVQNALYAIGQPESWEELVKVGTAVKSAIGENGRAMFVEWAENSHWGRSNPKRKERHNFSNNYNGFNTQKVSSGTLIWLANNRTNGEFSRQNAKGDFQQTPEYLARQAESRRIAAENAQKAAKDKAQKDADTIKEIQGWFTPNALRAKPSHPYLRRKGVTEVPSQLTYYGGKVQIPLYDKDGNIVSAQILRAKAEDGKPQKQVMAPYAGAFFLFGDLKNAHDGVIMAEGFVTAYSLHKATGL